MEAIFSYLNLKHDGGFLPYSMPEGFNKTGHSLTDIIIVWAESKLVLHPEIFGQNDTYIYWVLEWDWRLSTMVGGSAKSHFRI